MRNLRLTSQYQELGEDLFNQLLRSEDEDAVERVLNDFALLTNDEDDPNWKPLGDMENNFGGIGNQQSDPTAALVEKIVNSIDAVLMAKFYESGIDLESESVPRSMSQAVEKFFGVSEGAIERLSTSEQKNLAENIYLIATGEKQKPSYLIVDRGEGHTPNQFPNTFLSLYRSNKMRIPFVQGKFNSGGTGVLQFCGERNRNYQLIVSRRNPNCPAEDDDTRHLWGYTIVRRLPPSGTRRSSVYVYLAPGGHVPTFNAPEIKVLSEVQSSKQPDEPYARSLPYGTCVKLYNYRWKARSILTTEGRYELERLLHRSCLPFRVSETRKFNANSFSATVTGGWSRATAKADDEETTKLETGFPASGEISLPQIGKLHYQVVVFKTDTDAGKRGVPAGVSFVVNGQVHGTLSSDYVSRKLKYDYLAKKGPLLVSVDCTNMAPAIREDFFMSSRDRVRKNESYDRIEAALTEELRAHRGLQELNQLRRKEEMEEHQSASPIEAFQDVVNKDPSLASLFGRGARLVTGTGPSKKLEPYQGREFPSFFRLSSNPKNGLEKRCPVNRTVKLEFETDAVNEYFSRVDNPGAIHIFPQDLLEASSLWNGRYEARFRVPWNAQIGDRIEVRITVSDIQRDAIDSPFISTFTLIAEQAEDEVPVNGVPKVAREPKNTANTRRPTLEMPTIRYIYKSDWGDEFNKHKALDIKSNPEGGFDFTINLDCTFYLTELANAREGDKPKLKVWFSYGLVLAAVSMIKHHERLSSNQDDQGSENQDVSADLDAISRYCDGLAQVIIPIVRALSSAPTEAFESDSG